MPIFLKAANTAREKDAVYRLRYRVFVEEEQRFDHPSNRIYDIYDTLDENVNFIAMEGDEVVHDESKCKGCGRCVSVCPENAVRAQIDDVDEAVG
ncbi:4Fe-4S binding protein, partial [Desulfosarcina sp.]|uniref:4Fe-4S binding protein n=1 Tax=Desulfosarcina sp. TaxID=2027861 RepID=UPI003562E9B0